MRGDVDGDESQYVTVEKPAIKIRREAGDIFDEQSSYMVISANAVSRQSLDLHGHLHNEYKPVGNMSRQRLHKEPSIEVARNIRGGDSPCRPIMLAD